MPIRPCAQARLARWAWGLAAFGLMTSAALAAPDDAVDPVTRLLLDRGLIEAPAAPTSAPVGNQLLRQVRERASEMVLTALNYVGVRYRRGGNSEETGFDCSGFTRYVIGSSLGLVLPRRADEQASAPGLVAVKREDLQPGDLVFFNTLKRTFSHVGIYIGDNRFVHAPRPGGEIRTEDMGFTYWKKRFTGARRAEMVAAAPPATTETVVSDISMR